MIDADQTCANEVKVIEQEISTAGGETSNINLEIAALSRRLEQVRFVCDTRAKVRRLKLLRRCRCGTTRSDIRKLAILRLVSPVVRVAGLISGHGKNAPAQRAGG